MALFEVPGWSVPADPVADASAKSRKRKHRDHDDDGAADAKVQSAAMNLEKLVASLGPIVPTGADKASPKKKSKKAKGKEVARPEPKKRDAEVGRSGQDTRARAEKARGQGKKEKVKQQERGREAERPATPSATSSHSPERQTKKQKRKKGKREEEKAEEHPAVEISKPPQPAKKAGGTGLTALQAGMKQSLDGARFRCVRGLRMSRVRLNKYRWINETLYKSDSAKAHEMMRENPSVFSEVRVELSGCAHSLA